MGTENRLSAVTVSVYDLIEQVKANRETHKHAFDHAMRGFRVVAEAELEKRIVDISKGRILNLKFTLPLPEDHTADYDRVLQMLKMTYDAGQQLIVLDELEQAQYVMDDWAWKRAFAATSTFYQGSE